MTSSFKLLRAWFLAITWGALIWSVSSMPLHGPVFESAAKKHLDWVVHAIEYGLFARFVLLAFMETFGPAQVRRAMLWTAFLVCLFAVVDEIHQSTVPYRSCDVRDAWADMTGVLILLTFYLRRLSKKNA